ncbi:MAG: phage holin family protein [Anaerolineales bacterium]|nr:phage holin family protein [Anaerolineales bacterium]
MNKFIIRWLINALAIFATIYLVPGLQMENESWIAYAILGLIFGVVNAVIRPLLKIMTCPLIILTLGLFTLVINTMLLYITSWVGSWFDYSIFIKDFWSAFVGALIISVISLILSLFVRDELYDKKRSQS